MEAQFNYKFPGDELIINGKCPLITKNGLRSEKCGCLKKKKLEEEKQKKRKLNEKTKGI